MINFKEIINGGEYLEKEKYMISFAEVQNNYKTSFRKFECEQTYSFLGEPNYKMFVNQDIVQFVNGLEKFYFNNLESSKIALKKGIKKSRLRFIKEPIDEYIKFQYYSYLIQNKLGQVVRFFTDENNLPQDIKDFIIFDDTVAFILDFSEDKFRGVWEIKNKKSIKKLIEWYDRNYQLGLENKKILEPSQVIMDLLKVKGIIDD